VCLSLPTLHSLFPSPRAVTHLVATGLCTIDAKDGTLVFDIRRRFVSLAIPGPSRLSGDAIGL
jgi:hypothetical protein